MKKTLARLRTPIGFTISILLVYLVLFNPHMISFSRGEISLTHALFGDSRISVEDIGKAWELLIPSYALMGVALLAGSLFIRAWRWQLIMRNGGFVRYWTVFHTMNLGYLLNNVLPLRAGEVLRAVIVGRRENRSVTSTITSVVVERLFDLSGLVMVFGLTMIFYPFPTWLKAAGGVLTVLTLGMLLAGYILSRSTDRLERFKAEKFSDPTTVPAKIAHRVILLIEGFGVLKSPLMLFHTIWTTAALNGIYVAVMKLVFDAFQLNGTTYPALDGGTWVPAMVLTVITSLGFAIPSAPGGVGTYHAAVLLGLSWFGVDQGLAVIFAATIHAVNYITLSIAGAIGLWLLKLKWSDVVKTAKSTSDSEGSVDIPSE